MGTTGASEQTRKAVLRKAKELDYRPNTLAVALKSGRKNAVGMFLHRMGTPGSEVVPKFLVNSAEIFSRSGHRLWLRFFESDAEFLEACDNNLKRDIDGLIVAGVMHPGLVTSLMEIVHSGLPLVAAFGKTAEHNFRGSVNVDNEMQGFLPTIHLLERGCRRLVHFRTLESRYEGFLRAHKEMRLPVDETLVIPGEGFALEDGERSTAALIAGGRSFDGIVAASDAQASGAFRVLLSHGIRVPQDVKLTGVDNSPLAEACAVPLTSATPEMQQCGRIAAEMLLRSIAGESVEPVTLVPRLVVRASSQ
jgi:LacI family transcriptional regulator